MSTIKGVFVPFADYVQKQLTVRKNIIANSKNISFLQPGSSVPIEIPAEFHNNFNLYSRGGIYSEDAFYGYTVEKQCILRMMSGVDLRLESDGIRTMFANEFKNSNLQYLVSKGENFAKQYILESGTQFYNERGNFGGLREGFIPDNLADPTRGFAYGDQNVRSNADDDFGIVPMPGIIDAEIRTKSDNGSLREAIVNFVCHNRKQLEILEMLYMRPGMPLVLEWGWNPYIDNNGIKRANNFTTRELFFNSNSDMDTIMAKIRKYKIESGGNFDGVMGYCKNFSFKANEVGGYDCTTEIMAYGEIIETLKPQKVYKETKDVNSDEKAVEIEDSLLFYLRSIKNTLRTPQSITSYQAANVADKNNPGGTKKIQEFTFTQNGVPTTVPEQTVKLKTWESMRTPLGYVGNGCPSYYGDNKLININYGDVAFFQCVYENNVIIPVQVGNANFQNIKEYTSEQKVLGNKIFGPLWKSKVTTTEKEIDKFIPQPYDPELYKDIQGEEVTIDVNYLKSMSYEDYNYFFDSGQNPVPSAQSFGDYLTKVGTANLGLRSGAGFGLSGLFENGEWGLQRRELISRGVQLDVENGFSKTDVEAAVKQQQENLKSLFTKLENYKRGYFDIVQLVNFICKGALSQGFYKEGVSRHKGLQLSNDNSGIGLQTFLGGMIVKQVVKYDEQGSDSGYRKKIYVRWDLVCQIMNHLCTYKANRASDLDLEEFDGDYTDEAKAEEEMFINMQLKIPDTEITYMIANKRTWNNDKIKGKTQGPQDEVSIDNRSKQTDSSYIPYTAPYVRTTDPIQSIALPAERRFDGDTTLDDIIANNNFTQKQIQELKNMEAQYGESGWRETLEFYEEKQGLKIQSDTAGGAPVNSDVEYKTKKLTPNIDYHPIIGASLDENICLMPHQPIFDEMFAKDQTSYNQGISYDETNRSSGVKPVAQNKSDVNFQALSSYNDVNNGTERDPHKANDRHSIGYVYFNLDFLINKFMEMRLKEFQSETNDGIETLNKNFAYFDYIKAIWDAANAACGHYYQFVIHCEHERSNFNRIIDMRVSGKPEDVASKPIYEFSPQGLKSITRQFYYDTSISNDLSSAIAIAARNPADMQELDALSFKAFNKNIKNRFILEDADELARKQRKALKDQLIKDIKQYNNLFNSLQFYLHKMYSGNFQTETIQTTTGLTLSSINMGTAILHLEKLRDLRMSINYRIPLKDGNGKDNEDAGKYLIEGFTQDFSPIIPIKFNIEMDGIAGMIPLQMFKVDPTRLPLGYKANSRNLAFIVDSESQKITQNQDWTVQVSGQMVFLNSEDIPGNNILEENVLDFGTRKIYQTQSSIENVSTNADLLRNVIVQYGHTENNHVGKRGPEYKSGELSSGGDITSELKDFGIFFLKVLADPTTYGYSHNLTKVKFRFTAGNDIHHQQNTPNSKHVIGNGLDFVITSGNTGNKTLDGVLDLLREIKRKNYSRLYIKDEYRYPNEGGQRNEYTTGPHIHIDLR